MAKTKTAPVGLKPEKVKSKDTSSVKDGAIVKLSQTSKSKSIDLAKQVAAKATNGVGGKKASKKAKKEPTPEPSSDESESESDEGASDVSSTDSADDSKSGTESDSSSDAESSDSEANVGATEKPRANGDVKMDISSETVQGDADTSESSDSSTSSVSSDDDDSDEEVASAPKAVNGTAKNAKPDETSSDDESTESGSSDSSSDSASDSADEESSSEEESEEEAPATKKRKAEETATPMAKKTKTDEEAAGAKTNLFVGQLSWNVDNEWLTREFEAYGQLESARVMTDRDSGRSRGFGYVEFANEEDAQKALEAMTGKEIDGRAIKLDLAEKRKPANSTPGFQDREKKYGDREKSAPADTLFVGNLPFAISQDVVWEAFKEHGEPTSVRLPTDRETGEPKGFGYVSFNSVEEATKVLNSMNGEYVGDRPIRLDFSGPKPDNGGARGGRGGGFGDRGGRGGRGGRGRGGFDRGGRGGGRGGSTNRGGVSDFKGKKMTF